MSTTSDEAKIYTQLRDRAEAQLAAGAVQTNSHWSMGIDALRLLHQLSSNPDSAEDALKLLHELQIHQVELDLQNEEIAANEQARVEELTLYRELFDAAPLGYFLVDREGMVIEANSAAATLFGITRNFLAGHRIDSFLAPENRPQLIELLQRVAHGGAGDSCMVPAGGGAMASRPLLFLASSSSNREYVLLACCEFPGDR